ncbi:MAG: gamma-glutamyltransferase [Solirubrobacterales bacterium]|nr:gamma-glutamyltransferase [Solirubrobacterales bacterium]
MTPALYETRYATRALVCTVDALAAQAGLEALRAGGTAADAAIAACAVLAVTQQHQCGLGGDLLCLVHIDGEGRPSALNASGRAGSGADPERLRAAGHRRIPAVGDPACAPVPGCVDGWLALHERFGRLPFATLLERARHAAAEGFAASPGLAAASQALAEVPAAEQVTGAEDFTGAGALRAGQLVRRPGVARVLEALAAGGRDAVYGGEFGRAVLAVGAGEYVESDLARSQAEWVAALGIEAFGGRLWSLPPNSQGYLTLASAAVASELELPAPGEPLWAHLLIETSRAAAADRDAVWHEGSDGEALISPARLEELRSRVSARRAASVAAAPVAGGTVSLCVVDGAGMAVSLLQSNFQSWGSMLFLPGIGVPLHDRGASFSLRPGHPALYGPGRRPPHTLAPALLTGSDGSLRAALATRGGEIQPQILLQLLSRLYAAGQPPAEAMAAGRFAVLGDEVLVEGHAPAPWAKALAARGHPVSVDAPFAQEFGHAQLIVRTRDGFAGASDPRSESWGVAGW